MSLTAYIYYRFSTLAQDAGSSKARQIQDCSALCAQKGWEIAEVFGDAGRSAWSGAHLNGGKLGGFADRVRAGEIGAGSVLVVEKLDRLSRQEIVVARNWIEEMCSLRNPAVEGDYIKGFLNPNRVKDPGSVHVPGYYPRIVDADLVARARAAVDGRKLTGGRYKAKVTNLFTSGLAVCGACGSRMHMRSNGDPNGPLMLQCHNAGRNRGCTQTQMFRYRVLEAGRASIGSLRSSQQLRSSSRPNAAALAARAVACC